MRLKDISILNPQYNGESLEKEVSFVPMESLRYDALDLQEISFAEGKGKYTYFADGDLLIAKVTPCFENGNVAVAKHLKEGIGFGSSEIFVLRMNGKAYSRYMFYYVQTENFQNKACATMCGVGGLKRISPLFMRTHEFDIPPLPVQQRIVSYLDAKTTEIDRRISLLEKKRDAYLHLKTATINHAVTRGLNSNAKLKDSCVEWIGLVPEHWEVKRLKEEVLCIQSGKRPADDKEDVLSIGGEHIQNGMFYLENKKYVSSDTYHCSQGKIEIGDTLVVKDGATIGKCMFVDEKPEERMIVNEHVYRIKCSKYIFYFLSSPFSQYWFRSRNMSSAQESINRTTIDNLPTLIPSLSEQIEISDFLDSECIRIDAVIKIVDNQIDAYKRLKRSLINEVVTGQRTV